MKKPRDPDIHNHLVGALPIIKYYTDRLKIVETIDRIVPKAPQSPVSHGECILALLISALLGDHRLCFVEHKLRDFDLTYLFGRSGIEAKNFNDTRIGVALDALYSHTQEIYGIIVCAAILEFKIRPKRFHVDSTSIILRGVYEILEVLPSLLEPPPIPARGHSKEHRPDLLQLMFGLVSTDEGIPVLGRFENGNSGDSKLFRNYMVELAGMLDDLRATDAILVGDSKLCSLPTITEAAILGFPLITMLPDTFNWRSQYIGYASREENLPLLLTTEDGETYHGKSWKLPTTVDLPDKPKSTVWLRCLVVYSSQLAKAKQMTRKRAIIKERKSLETFAARLLENHFACQKDAQKVANRDWKAMKLQLHEMSLEVRQEEIDVTTKKRGRRPKNAPPPTIAKVWKAKITVTETIREETPYDPDGFFVLVTSVTDGRRSDAQLLQAYKGQQVVELSFKWMKGPLATNPVNLQLVSRIQSLGFVILLAVLFSSLLQRDARKALKKQGGKVPNYPGRRSDKPTWQGILSLFERVSLTRVSIGGVIHKAIHNLDADQYEILTLLGIPEIYETYSNDVYS